MLEVNRGLRDEKHVSDRLSYGRPSVKLSCKQYTQSVIMFCLYLFQFSNYFRHADGTSEFSPRNATLLEISDCKVFVQNLATVSTGELYIHVTVHRNRFLFNNQAVAQIIQILFCHKTPHVSGIFSAHHQEFSTVHSALVSFVQVSDDRFQAE